MKTKDKYIQPLMEVVEVQPEGVIATSVRVNTEGEYNGSAGSKKRDLWE